LGAQLTAHEFEGGALVIIKAPHHSSLDFIGSAEGAKPLLHPFEVGHTVGAQMVENRGGVGGGGDTALLFTVENPEGIAFQL
jgi:hypothetical protein